MELRTEVRVLCMPGKCSTLTEPGLVFKSERRLSEMAQWVKLLATQPNHRNLNPWTHPLGESAPARTSDLHAGVLT